MTNHLFRTASLALIACFGLSGVALAQDSLNKSKPKSDDRKSNDSRNARPTPPPVRPRADFERRIPDQRPTNPPARDTRPPDRRDAAEDRWRRNNAPSNGSDSVFDRQRPNDRPSTGGAPADRPRTDGRPRDGGSVFDRERGNPRPGSGGGSVFDPPRGDGRPTGGSSVFERQRGSDRPANEGGSVFDRQKDSRGSLERQNSPLFQRPVRDGQTFGDPLQRGRSIRTERRDLQGQSNNLVRTNVDQRLEVDRLPSGPRPSLQTQVRRSEQVSLSVGGWRVGYVHYRPDWCDSSFGYGWYAFNPWAYDRVVFSPWYYYPFLPAYVSPVRVFSSSWWPSCNWSGAYYRWSAPRWDYYDDLAWARRDRGDLDYAIGDIVRAFDRNDLRSVDALVPRDGDVAIFADGRYSYSLRSGDFYDMFADAVESSNTIDYRIEDVRFSRGSARVLARHEFRDPWGGRQTVYHYYFFVREGGDFVIREFGTSNRRSW